MFFYDFPDYKGRLISYGISPFSWVVVLFGLPDCIDYFDFDLELGAYDNKTDKLIFKKRYRESVPFYHGFYYGFSFPEGFAENIRRINRDFIKNLEKVVN